MLLSLHPIKSFERESPESVPHVTSRQGEREGECPRVSERQSDRYRERGSGGCQAEKAVTDTVKRTGLLFNYRQCMLGKSTEHHQDRRTQAARGQSGYD